VCVVGVRARVGRLLGVPAAAADGPAACAHPDVAALARADAVLGELERSRAAER
jgi:hypothetical protein